MPMPKPFIPALIVNVLTGTPTRIEMLPEEFSESNNADLQNIDITGRSSPLIGYAGGGPKTVSINLPLHDDLCSLGIVQTVNNLKALTYPEYGGSIEPPKSYLRVGTFFKIFGACESCDVTWRKPYREDHVSGEMTYIYAEVSLSFTNVVEVPFSASSVQGGKDTDI